MSGLLQGKRALVTGASRGIGAAIARRLAADGADVAITYERSTEAAEAVVAELKALDRRALAIKADSADPAAVRAVVDQAAQAFGGLDILVNNAGIFRAGSLDDITLDDIDATLAVNVRAVIVASQAAARHMGDGGRIISIGSNLASRVPDAGKSLYSMSKSALIAWTQGLARDLGGRGITVNIVHPGSTDTDMNPAAGAHAEAQRSRMAIPRYGRAEDVAELVAFVAGPAGRSINGAGLTIDGGANA
ncbi:SDR family oxidoreductase [Bradyrhizobium sp. U87765 SZCCT0131]|uniref:SDR family NAD(P)-dependent oxidoreductase n=1 Tax=unclassified Bradyrhizobium TaxID=2631580 RepID=UPI001BA8AB27|nr:MULTISPECIES: SDR family NAD(P)-dependent oxidoreductase [unclassified Bradyrhizobium]MBR1217327.1 SDR family oxidoreductase [Bradyrhizobium sp. U87765 SZCCT0131]MBR1265076.1 SDR family oxidoreductase [Bradyrhizobium sp. U87765 SZCCT0134]MBR1305058.1 SDR family oxidoreductase [Bradyrhizobium sp. U87765 SZCCT0110]MBR1320844.1 SDR family oxidoreductase [Bradyrhizobium sp. U87765 SZCCT0109]MBR1349264.1 SDR family oxidoreductase [Bradyrhizobium sp. U87765 SZCCT0048]